MFGDFNVTFEMLWLLFTQSRNCKSFTEMIVYKNLKMFQNLESFIGVIKPMGE